jgi:hypothetical protein
MVTGENSPSQDVTWSVKGAAYSGTTISIGGQGYETLEAAVSAVAGKTAAIMVISDITVSSTIMASAANTNITLTGSGTFTMKTSSVKDNTAYGMHVNGGTFTMGGGSVEGNTGSGGGGVYLLFNITAITKAGGIIYGSNASTVQVNIVTGQTGKGAAVLYVNVSGDDVRPGKDRGRQP